MADETTDISRRKVLGSVATIGGAAALGGAGSVAFLSDEETFANNRLVAGELDLKVDWQEHYSDWSDDESEDITASMDPGEGLTGLPSAAPDDEKLVYVSDPQQFLDNTAIEAYPDTNDDGVQDLPEDWDICEQDADTPAVLSSGLRTNATLGEEPNPQTTEPGDPLIAIEDVKPGDFGEVTFSFHVCGNPAFVWLTGALRDASENGLTEPERKDDDEEEGVVELLDEVRAAVWYDDGDNIAQDDEEILLRGSLRDVLGELGAGMVPLDADPTTDERECFPNSTTAYLGFEWWLPVNHANEIQTDSAAFDLGFYTEQCRHNDGQMGNNGGDGGGGPGGEPGNGIEGEQAISFIAACSESGVSQSDANFRVTDVLDRDGGQPSAVSWAADEPIDAVVLAFGSAAGEGEPRFTTYFYEPGAQSGMVATGADEDGSFDDRDGSPETYPRSLFDDQSSSDPCPDGYTEVVKLEEGDEIDP